jgi:8-oxo-dGTP pyrophosphatase MutT (NUDIX family)
VQGLPRDLPILEREAVRLVVRDSLDRILLFHTHEITIPEYGLWWELPGGGIEPGETYREAARRELHEEAGLTVEDAQMGEPTWTRDGSFRHRGVRHLQHEVVVQVRLPGPGPDIDVSGRLDYEHEDYFAFRWWPIAEVTASTARFYPGHLPRLLPRFLAGETIQEPPEVWP